MSSSTRYRPARWVGGIRLADPIPDAIAARKAGGKNAVFMEAPPQALPYSYPLEAPLEPPAAPAPLREQHGWAPGHAERTPAELERAAFEWGCGLELVRAITVLCYVIAAALAVWTVTHAVQLASCVCKKLAQSMQMLAPRMATELAPR